MNPGFGGWTANNADGLARAFSGTRVGLSALTADRQTTQMPDAPVAFDALEALKVHADLPAQIAFDNVLAVLDGMDDLRELLLSQILGPDATVNIGLGEDVDRIAGADPVDVTESDIDALIGRDFYSYDTCHIFGK